MTELPRDHEFNSKGGRDRGILLAFLLIFVIGLLDAIAYQYEIDYLPQYISGTIQRQFVFLEILSIIHLAILLSISFVLFTRITVQRSVILIILILLLGSYLGQLAGLTLLTEFMYQSPEVVASYEYASILIQPLGESIFLSFTCTGAMFVRAKK